MTQEYPKWVYPGDVPDAARGVLVADAIAEDTARRIFAEPEKALQLQAEERLLREELPIRAIEAQAIAVAATTDAHELSDMMKTEAEHQAESTRGRKRRG